MPLPGHSAERTRRFYAKAEAAPAEGGFAVARDLTSFTAASTAIGAASGSIPS